MKARRCPVGPDICGDIEGWDAFIQHIYEHHTNPAEPDGPRIRAVDEILKRGPVPAESRVVPKVTADPRTHALWALAGGNAALARQLVGAMGTSERRAYLAQLTELINMLWSEPS